MNLDKYFSNEYLKRLETTAKYPNRLKDKKRIEKVYGLEEFGNNSTKFLSVNNKILFAIGYTRIVYGDHGPYIEFKLSNFIQPIISKFNSQPPLNAYYEWMTLEDDDIKIYRQLKDVKNLPNPPAPGYKGNRAEGYADYIPGEYYISPLEISSVSE